MKYSQWLIVFILISISIFINARLITFFGTSDMSAFVRAGSVSNHFGYVGGYSVYNLYYPPLAQAILGLVNKIDGMPYESSMINDYPSVYSIGRNYIPIKASLLIFSCVTFFLIFLYLYKGKKYPLYKSIITSILLSFNPAFLEITQILGYIDIYFVPTLLLSIFLFIYKKYFLAGTFFSITFLIKLVPIFLLPIFAVHFIKISYTKKYIVVDWKNFTTFMIGMGTIAFPIVFIYNWREVLDIVVASANHGTYLSLNALNLSWVYRILFEPSNIASPIVSLTLKILFSINIIFMIYKITVSKESTYSFLSSLFLTSYAYFIFFTGAHENHLFLTVVLSLCLFLYRDSVFTRWAYFGTSIALFSNLFIFYQFGINQTRLITLSESTMHTLTIIFSIMTIVLYLALLTKYLRNNEYT